MSGDDSLSSEVRSLRDRLSRLSQASLRINESLDLDSVLQLVVDSACSLTSARYAVLAVLDDAGALEHFVTAGFSPEELAGLLNLPEGPELFDRMGAQTRPVRVPDFFTLAESLGFPGLELPEGMGPQIAFLWVPIVSGGRNVGTISVAVREGGGEFSVEDEETLVMFASQSALVISNSRRYRDEQRSRADLEALINTSPVGILVFDAKQGVLRAVNREARRISAELRMETVPDDQLLNRLVYRRADGRAISMDEFPVAQALATGETVRAEEVVIESPNGRSVTTLVNATPILGEGGDVETVVVTVQDLTPLEEQERIRAEFVGMVSHELRTPLTTIRGSAMTLVSEGDDLDPAEVRQFHRMIAEQADNMRGLIGDLLDVTSIEAGALSVEPLPIPVEALVDEATRRFSGGGARHAVRVELASSLPEVMADRRRIVQVLGNLLSNAARYSPETAPITVGAVQDGLHVALSVSDMGRGVAPERLPYLFRKYYAAGGQGGAGDSENSGSGLGLAISRGIVEAHGGRIWAESDGLGSGTKFTLTLPVADSAGVGPWSGSSSAPGEGRPMRGCLGPVLVVDDDPQALRYVRGALTRAGYTAVVTGDPDEAVGLVEQHRPVLVLMDLFLPGVDGVDLMGRVLDVADVPVIFISAYGQDENVARAFEAGASDYLVKPFSPTELVARAAATLRSRATRESARAAEPYRLGALTVDFANHMVLLHGQELRLRALEYRVLSELAARAGRVVTYDRLIQRVWGEGAGSDLRPLRTVMTALRQKLGDEASNPRYIFTEPRLGYRMPEGDGAPDPVAGG